jgi:methionyl aminopeptidase
MSVRPGVRYRDIGNEIQSHTHSNGYSVVRSYCGHGINRLMIFDIVINYIVFSLFHTVPNVPHYASKLTIIHLYTIHLFIHSIHSSIHLSIHLYIYSSIYLSENKAIGVMKPGHTFTIEPMISEGQLHSHSINHSFILKGCGKTSHGRMAGLQ